MEFQTYTNQMNLLLHFGEIFRDSVNGTTTAIAGFYTTAIFLLTNQVTWIGVVIAVKYFNHRKTLFG